MSAGVPFRVRLDGRVPPLEPTIGLGLAFAFVALLGAAWILPAAGFGLPCTFLHLTGLPCLTCGMTRAFVALVHGHPLDAWRWNPLGALACLACSVGALYLVGRQLGMPAWRVELGTVLQGRWRALCILTVAVNWGFVVASGRVA